MAVTNVVIRNRKGKATLTGGKRVRTYQAIYHVKCDSINEDPYTIISNASIPQLYPISFWPTDAGAVLVDVDPQQDMEKPDHWTVTCSYTSNPDIKDPDSDPLARPAVIDRSPQQRQRILTRDVDGVLIVNSANEFFNPPVEREEHAPALTISKNMTVWPYALELALTDAINSDVITYVSKGIAYGIGLVKCNGFTGKEAYENGIKFWSVSVALEVNWEGWNKPIVDCGFREKIATAPYIRPIIGSNGDSVTEPVMLNGAGVADPSRSSPYLLTYKKHRQVAFAPLFAMFGIF